MQSKFRLTRSEDFKRVRHSGRSYTHPLVVLVAKPGALNHVRIGVAAGKPTGTAVHRNRAKRLLREVMRPLIPSLPSGWDLILIARPGLVTASLTETREAVTNLLHRAKLLPTDES